MGRSHTISPADTATAPVGIAPLARIADLVVAGLALLVALPLLVALACAVRFSSHGRVLHREPAIAPNGRRVNLLTFRTVMDGGGTDAHARVRSVVGAAAQLPVTGVGRVLRRTKLDRLPRLINVVAGHRSLFGRR